MPTADAHSIMATTEDRDELQARIAALQSEVEVLRAANAELSGTAGRRAGDLTARELRFGFFRRYDIKLAIIGSDCGAICAADRALEYEAGVYSQAG